MDINSHELGRKIRLCRLARRMTQEELGGGLYSKSYISQLERGAVEPSLRALKVIAHRLGVSCGWLLEGSPSSASFLLDAASACYYLGDLRQSEFLLERARGDNPNPSPSSVAASLLLNMRINAARGKWSQVVSDCIRLEKTMDEAQSVSIRDQVSHRYWWGKAFLELGNRRKAVIQWEQGLQRLGAIDCLPTYETISLMEELSQLYIDLGDQDAGDALKMRVQAIATQIKSITDLTRWVLARFHDGYTRRFVASDHLAIDRADSMRDAHAWSRGVKLLETVRSLRPEDRLA